MQSAKRACGMFAALALATLALQTPPACAGPKKTTMDTPTVTCVDSTQASICLQVCAGATGAPAGFSIQWETAPDYANGPDGISGTADDNSWRLSEAPGLCKASFSGNASLSRYNLGAGECVTVNVGEFLFDNGASTNCLDALTCGTTYVFRAFAHATSTLNRSNFTANLTCSTLPCGHTENCTLTQGYWKTHYQIEIRDMGIIIGYTSAWPQSVLDNGMDLGSVHYTAAQLEDIFNTPAGGGSKANGLIALAHQLIAAKLNIANGADGTDAAAAIAAADTLIGGLIVPPVGTGYLDPSLTSALTTALTNYNEGATGPGHCE